MTVFDLASPLEGCMHGLADFVCEISLWIADFTFLAFLSVLTNSCAIALYADVSSPAMLAGACALTLYAVESSFAMIANSGAFANFALEFSFAVFAKVLGVAFYAAVLSLPLQSVLQFRMKTEIFRSANSAIPLHLVMWASLTTSHFVF